MFLRCHYLMGLFGLFVALPILKMFVISFLLNGNQKQRKEQEFTTKH